MEILETVIALLLNLIVTAVAYLLVPIIIIISKKKYTKKKLKRIVIFNGIGVFILFTILYGILGVDQIANMTATFLWSTVSHVILKRTSRLDDEKDMITANLPNAYPENKNVSNRETSISKDNTFDNICISPESEQSTNDGTRLSDLAFTPAQEASSVSTSPMQCAIKEAAPVPKKEKPVKMKYCSRCGAIIDNNTKVCTGCGKQYFKGITKRSLPIIILSFIIIIISAVSVYYNMQLVNEVEDLKESIEVKNSVIDSKNNSIDRLTDQVAELRDENYEYYGLSQFVDDLIAIVGDDGTGLYHKYGCEELDAEYIWIYNNEAAKGQGYYPCDECH